MTQHKFDTELGPLTKQQWQIAKLVSENRGIHLSELARLTGKEASMVNRVAAALIKKQLIRDERQVCPSGSRVYRRFYPVEVKNAD